MCVYAVYCAPYSAAPPLEHHDAYSSSVRRANYIENNMRRTRKAKKTRATKKESDQFYVCYTLLLASPCAFHADKMSSSKHTHTHPYIHCVFIVLRRHLVPLHRHHHQASQQEELVANNNIETKPSTALILTFSFVVPYTHTRTLKQEHNRSYRGFSVFCEFVLVYGTNCSSSDHRPYIHTHPLPPLMLTTEYYKTSSSIAANSVCQPNAALSLGDDRVVFVCMGGYELPQIAWRAIRIVRFVRLWWCSAKDKCDVCRAGCEWLCRCVSVLVFMPVLLL